MRTRAKPNADIVIAGKIDNKNPLGFRVSRTDIGGVAKVANKSEIFEGCTLEKTTIPHLEMGSIRVDTVRKPYRTSILWSGELRWDETVHAEQRIIPSEQSLHLKSACRP